MPAAPRRCVVATRSIRLTTVQMPVSSCTANVIGFPSRDCAEDVTTSMRPSYSARPTTTPSILGSFAASRASMSAMEPTPPDAITAMDRPRARAAVAATLTPLSSPSPSISVNKMAATPAFRRAARSVSGMIPPPNSRMSAAPCSFSRVMTRGNRVIWAPEWMLRPMASTSSSIAMATISSGVRWRPE